MREPHRGKVVQRAWLFSLMVCVVFCRAKAQTGTFAGARADNPPEARAVELRVRLYAIHSPVQLRISPRDASARVSLCVRCESKRLRDALEIRAAGSQIALSTEGHATEESASILRVSGSYRLASPGNAPLELAFPLELHAESGHLRVDVMMPLEDYVAAVLAGEGLGLNSDESLKAMAVVARTFALHFRGRHRAEGFDLCDTTHCQDLHLGALNARMRAAAQATRGEILWYAERPAATYHHRHCGGSTEDARVVWPDEAAPYLRAQKDPYCLARDAARWSTEIAKREIAAALTASHLETPTNIETLTILERSASGRAVRLWIAGPANQDGRDMRAADLRFAVGRALGWDKIPSDLYDLRDTGATLVFEGRGAGHGVGMCQTGAEELGSRGHTYREILGFYFPGTTLCSLTPTANPACSQ